MELTSNRTLPNSTYFVPGFFLLPAINQSMTKVYPNVKASSPTLNPSDQAKAVLTVWKKSLLFNCQGFTVFDNHGSLVFRVDNYYAAAKAETLLMDASGNSLLTIRRKRLSLADSWLVFDEETAVHQRFSVKKNINLLNTKSLAQVTQTNTKKVVYEIEGCYTKRCCAVYDDKRRRVAEIKPKEGGVKGVAFGLDVFTLIVHEPHHIDSSLAMALVIILDQMFRSNAGITKRIIETMSTGRSW